MIKWRCSWRPYLTEENAQKRLQWAYRYRHFVAEYWARVYWSDECTIERGIGIRREWTFTRPHTPLQFFRWHARSLGVSMRLVFARYNDTRSGVGTSQPAGLLFEKDVLGGLPRNFPYNPTLDSALASTDTKDSNDQSHRNVGPDGRSE